MLGPAMLLPPADEVSVESWWAEVETACGAELNSSLSAKT